MNITKSITNLESKMKIGQLCNKNNRVASPSKSLHVELHTGHLLFDKSSNFLLFAPNLSR